MTVHGFTTISWCLLVRGGKKSLLRQLWQYSIIEGVISEALPGVLCN